MDKIGPEFVTLRNEQEGRYTLSKEGLVMKASKLPVTQESNPSYLGLRVQNHAFKAYATVNTTESDNLTKGLVLMQNEGFSLRVEVSENKASALLRQDGADKIIGQTEVKDGSVTFVIKGDGLKGQAGIVEGDKEVMFDEVDIRALSTEIAGGFVGCTVGIYASDNTGSDLTNSAVFTDFRYET